MRKLFMLAVMVAATSSAFAQDVKSPQVERLC